MSVVPSDFGLAEAVSPPANPFEAALERRKQTGPVELASAASRAIAREKELAKVQLTAEDIDSFRRQFPNVSKNATNTQIGSMVLDGRKFSQGQIGPRTRGFIEAAIRSPKEFGGALQRSAFSQAAMVFEANAVIADVLGFTDLRAEHKFISQSIEKYGEEVFLGRQPKEGVAAKAGEIVGSVLPGAASLVVSGGASSVVLAYYAIQAFGGAGQEYDEVLRLRGMSPKAIDRFAIATGSAIIEIATEKLSLDIIGKKLGPSLRKSIGDAWLRGKPRAIANILLKAEYISDVEATEEFFANLFNNALARNGVPFVTDGFDPERTYFENSLSAALQGKAGGLLLAPAGAFSPARRRARRRLTPDDQEFLRKQLGLDQKQQGPQPAGVRRDISLPVIAPSKPQVDPLAKQQVEDLDEADRAGAEDAALEVIADENAAPEAKEKAEQILGALDESTAPPVAEGEVAPAVVQDKAARVAFIKRLGIDTKRTDKPSVTEKQALKASLRSQKRVAEIVSRSITKKLKAAEKSKKAIEKKTRKLVRRLIRSVVSRDNQGSLLRQVEGATPENLRSILHEIDAVVGQDRVDEQLEDAKRMKKIVKKARRISNEARGLLLEHIAEAESRAKEEFGKIKSPQDRAAALRKAAVVMSRELSEASEVFAEEVATNTDLIEGLENQVRKDVKEVVSNINALEKGPLAKDKPTPILSRAVIEISDVRNLARNVENKKDDSGVLERLLWRAMTRAENKHYLHIARRLQQMEAAAKRAGFESLADAQAKLSGHGGEGVTDTVTVEIDGKEVEIPMGQAMWFTAIDAETEALLLEGASVVTREGLKQKGAVVSEEDLELDRIRAQVPQHLQDFVAELKEIANQDTDELMDVLLELNGRQPRRVTDYFRRRRNIAASDRKGLPTNFRDILIAYNENLGFTKEREGGTGSPIIVEDFVTVIIEQINDTSKVLYIARSVRNASAVLLNPEVQTAINNKHGSNMNEALALHLGAASLARRQRQLGARLIRAINANIAAAKLGLNPSSMARQLGGLARLTPILGIQGMADGIAGALEVTMHEMTSDSGFFWDRYISNISGRFGPVEAEVAFGKDRTAFVTTLDRAARNILAGDLIGGYLAAREIGLSTLEILNFFDSINARVAWASYKARVRREHPEWSQVRQTEWVAEKASDAVRETQNSSSPLDLSTLSIRAKGNIFSFYLAFTSDRFKVANRVRRAAAKGPAEGAKVVAAELVNIIWSVGVGTGTTLAVSLIVAFALGDEDDVEEAIARATKLDRLALNFAVEGASLIDPALTPRLIEAMTFNQAGVFDTPAGSSIEDLVKGVGKLVQSASQLSRGEQEKAISTFLRGSRDIGLEVGTLLGNPIDTSIRRVVNAYDKLDDNEQSKRISGR